MKDVKFTEEHHIIGASIAEEFLIKVGYPKDKIDLVKKCILNYIYTNFPNGTIDLV